MLILQPSEFMLIIIIQENLRKQVSLVINSIYNGCMGNCLIHMYQYTRIVHKVGKNFVFSTGVFIDNDLKTEILQNIF